MVSLVAESFSFPLCHVHNITFSLPPFSLLFCPCGGAAAAAVSLPLLRLVHCETAVLNSCFSYCFLSVSASLSVCVSAVDASGVELPDRGERVRSEAVQAKAETLHARAGERKRKGGGGVMLRYLKYCAAKTWLLFESCGD